MSRGLTTAAANAVQQEVVLRTAAVSLDFPSGYVRLNGSPVDLTIGGESYLGVGALGSITTVEEGATLQSYGLTLAVAGIPRDAVALAMTEAYQGRPARVLEVLLNRTTGAVIADPVVVFSGRMDQMSVALGQAATIRLSLISRLTDWDRPRIRRYTDEDQQRAHPGDLGLQFVAATVQKEIRWPAASFYKRQQGAAAGGSLAALAAANT